MIGPAMTRPSPPPTAVIAAITPTPVATFFAGNSSRMIPNESGSTPPPMPWIARPTTSTTIEWARPATTEPTARAPSVATQHALLADHVADPSHDRRRDRRRQQVRGHDPGDGVLGRVQAVLDRRQRRDHERLQQRVRGAAEEQDAERDAVVPRSCDPVIVESLPSHHARAGWTRYDGVPRRTLSGPVLPVEPRLEFLERRRQRTTAVRAASSATRVRRGSRLQCHSRPANHCCHRRRRRRPRRRPHRCPR